MYIVGITPKIINLYILQVTLLNHFLAQLFLPPDLWSLCKRLVTGGFLEKSCLYVLCIFGTWDFYAECCWVACWWNSICVLFTVWALELGCSIAESGILQLIFVLSSAFPLSNHRLVKVLFVSLCSPWYLLALQQCWRSELPTSYICIIEYLYPLFFSLILSYLSSVTRAFFH